MSWKTVLKRLDLRHSSLQARLTFFFAVSTTAILLVVSIFLYDSLRRQFRTEDEMELMMTTKVIGQAVRTVAEQHDSTSWKLTWAHVVDTRERLLVRVYSPDGSLFVETPNMIIPPAAFPAADPPLYSRWEPEDANGKRFLVTSFQVETAPGVIWRIQTAYNLTQSRQMLTVFKQQLSLVLVLALIVTLSIGWGIAYFGLRPLRLVSRSISAISPDNLSERIGDNPWPHELTGLTHSFDDMLARLEAAFAQLNQFSADLAHEVRTPVNNMLTAASVTLARDRDREEYQASLENILNEGNHLVRLVESMLFLARTENTTDALRLKPLAIAEELHLQIEFFEPFASEKGVRLAGEGTGELRANPELLRRALSNLIDNAIRHTPHGGAVSLSGAEGHGSVTITVRDTGVGIEGHHLDHLFNRFYRVDVARSKRTHAGLGLSLVQTIVKQHGGEIEVQSKPDIGTEFKMTFPKMTGL